MWDDAIEICILTIANVRVFMYFRDITDDSFVSVLVIVRSSPSPKYIRQYKK